MTIPIKPLDLSDSTNDTVKNLTHGLSANIGTTLADCWFLVFGGLSQKAERWCCIIKVDTLFSRILIYNHNQYENRRKTYGTESKIL